MEENVERDCTKKGDFNGRWGERQGRGHHMLGGIYQLVCTLHAAGRSGECPNVALASATEIHPDWHRSFLSLVHRGQFLWSSSCSLKTWIMADALNKMIDPCNLDSIEAEL